MLLKSKEIKNKNLEDKQNKNALTELKKKYKDLLEINKQLRMKTAKVENENKDLINTKLIITKERNEYQAKANKLEKQLEYKTNETNKLLKKEQSYKSQINNLNQSLNK